MLKTISLGAALAACLAGPAMAAPLEPARPLSLQLNTGFAPAESNGLSDLNVQTRRSTFGVIAGDALYGGIAGLAIGGGVALLEGSTNWARDLSIGAGAGLLIGGVFGALDVASNSDRIAAADVARNDGNSAFDQHLGFGGKF